MEQDFKKIINSIKNEINTTHIKVAVEINKNLLDLYYRLGKLLNDNFKYGINLLNKFHMN